MKADSVSVKKETGLLSDGPVSGNEGGKEALRQEYKQLLEIFDNLNSGVAIYEVKGEGEDFIFTYINKAGENFSKLKREDIIGRSVLQVFPGIKKMGLFEVFRQVWKTGEAQHHPSSVYQDDRIFQWVENHVYKLPDGKIAAIYDDITERKKIEEKNKVFFDAIASTFDCVMLIDKNGNFTYTNEASCKAFGYTPEEFLKLNIIKLDADPEVAKKIMQEVGVKGRWSGEVTNIRKNGEKFTSLLSAFVIKDEQGNPKGAMGILRDVTERKKANEAAQKAGEQFKQIFNFSPGGIAISTLEDGRFLEVNDAMLSIFGGSREEAIGHTARELNIWANSNERDILAKNLMKQKAVQSAEVMLRRRSGELFHASISMGLVDFGGKRCLIITAQDIERRKKMEEEFRKIHAELEKEKKLLIEKNIAFKEVIKEIEIEKNALKDDVIMNVNELILPVLKKVRLKGGVSRKYLDLIENNLNALTSSFGRRIIEKTLKLTPKEIEICNMVKSGLTTKEISVLLNASYQTIDKHRKNIRKKLGLSNKDINLTSFLKSL